LLGSLRPPFTDRARRTWARPVRGTGRAARSAETLGMATSRQRARQLSSPMCLAPGQCLLAYPMLALELFVRPVFSLSVVTSICRLAGALRARPAVAIGPVG
jgi:hypothetical protein